MAKLLTPVSTKENEKPSNLYGTINTKINPNDQANLFKPTSFQLDTPTGNLPDFKSKFNGDENFLGLVNLYQINFPEIKVEAKKQPLDLADALGFTTQPTLSDKDLTYSWTDGKRKFVYNTDTRTFLLNTLNVADLNTPAQNQGTIDTAGQFMSNFLSNVGITLKDNLAEIKDDYVRFNQNKNAWEASTKLVPSGDNKPNFVRATYLRKSRSRGLLPLPSNLDPQNPDATIVKEYYQNYDYSPVYMVIRNVSDPKPSDIIELSYYQYNYDITKPQTYNVKSVQSAYDELKNGLGTLIALRSPDNEIYDNNIVSRLTPIVKVNDIDVGYYLPSTKTTFAIPVYVFKCNFVISAEGINQKKATAIYYVPAFINP